LASFDFRLQIIKMNTQNSVNKPPIAPVIAAPILNVESPSLELEELVSVVGIAVTGAAVDVENLGSVIDESHNWVLYEVLFRGTMPWSETGGLKETDLFMPEIENRFEKLMICMLVLDLSVDTIPRKLGRGV
jgi:hypothetical protein